MKKKTCKLRRSLLASVLLLALLIGIVPLAPTAYAADITNLSATITLPVAGEHPNPDGTPGDPAKYEVYTVGFYDPDIGSSAQQTPLKQVKHITCL